MKKTISIIGSTGSIGLSTLKIIDKKKKLIQCRFIISSQKLCLYSFTNKKIQS